MSDKVIKTHFKASGWVLEYAEFEELAIKFLCREGIYFQYLTALAKHPNVFAKSRTIFSVWEWIKKSTADDYTQFINYSISWNATSEGSQFWADVEQKWMKYIRNTNFYHKYSS